MASFISPSFISQEPANGSCPEPAESSSQTHTLFIYDQFYIHA
jgi:hypothetical protein